MNTKGPATEAHERHMAAIKRISTAQGRLGYIADVRRIEGRFASKWLADDYAQWWADDQKKRQQKK